MRQNRGRFVAVVLLLAVISLCLSLWVNEGPLWRLVMLKQQEILADDGWVQGVVTVYRFGEVTRPFPIGHSVEFAVHTDAVPHGNIILWHSNGWVRFTGKFVHGKVEGLWTHWSETGKVIMQQTYEEGEWIEDRRSASSSSLEFRMIPDVPLNYTKGPPWMGGVTNQTEPADPQWIAEHGKQ